MSVDDARRLIADAAIAGVFPAAAVEVGDSIAVLWSEAFGAGTIHTPFDLASLTKVVATTTVVMDLVRTGAMTLAAPVSGFFDEWRGAFGRTREGQQRIDDVAESLGLAQRRVEIRATRLVYRILDRFES